MIDVETCPLCNSKSFQHHLYCKDYTVSHETFAVVSCASCRLKITNPRPEEQELSNYYISDSYISHANKGQTLIDRVYLIARNYTLKWKLNILKRYSTNATILLDYGCGTGHFLSACFKEGYKVSGVEPSKLARENSDREVNSFIHQTVSNVPQTEFDIITMWHVLEHIPEPYKILNDLKNKLKNNGTLFIAVPNPNSMDALKYQEVWAGYDVPRHLWHFSQSNIYTLSKSLSMKIIEVIPMKLDAFYVSLLSENYKHPQKKFMNYFSGFFNGLRSNIHAKKTGEYSSLIYVLKND